MADFLLQATLSNLLVSTALAFVAWVVQRRVRSASLANLLWAIVLVKMVTPPLFSLPVVEVPSVASFASPDDLAATSAPDLASESSTVVDSAAASSAAPVRIHATRDSLANFGARFWRSSYKLAIIGWMAVSALLFLVSACRIARFHWLLKTNAREHVELTMGLGEDVSGRLGILRRPRVFVSDAHVAPFVWWMAGRAVVVISQQAIRQLSQDDLRFVITHEMAHIKRRDHWFRWLEWFALLGLWWNPVMWWARAQLRISEEMACDDLVLRTTGPQVHQYASALLNMAELLTSPVIRPPAVASAINSGGNLEKRLTMMIAEKTWPVPVTLRLGIGALALCILPLGLVNAQDFEAVERRLGGAVEAGEISLQQASAMMDALRKSRGAKGATASRDREMEAKKRRYAGFAKEIERAVEAGKLSKKDAEAKLIEVRRDMFGDLEREEVARREKENANDMAYRKKRYMQFAREFEAAVEAGKLSKEDAEKQLIEVRKKMFGEMSARPEKSDRKKETRSQDARREMDARRQRYLEYMKLVNDAVDKGKLAKDAAEKNCSPLALSCLASERRRSA